MSDFKKGQRKGLVIFDAFRDNRGKGIKADNLLKILKELNQKDKKYEP